MVPSYPQLSKGYSKHRLAFLQNSQIGLLRERKVAEIHLQHWNVRIIKSLVTIDVKLVYPHAALIFTQFNNRTSVCRHPE